MKKKRTNEIGGVRHIQNRVVSNSAVFGLAPYWNGRAKEALLRCHFIFSIIMTKLLAFFGRNMVQ